MKPSNGCLKNDMVQGSGVFFSGNAFGATINPLPPRASNVWDAVSSMLRALRFS